jgi:uncharacterized protein YqhQ
LVGPFDVGSIADFQIVAVERLAALFLVFVLLLLMIFGCVVFVFVACCRLYDTIVHRLRLALSKLYRSLQILSGHTNLADAAFLIPSSPP